MSVSHQINETSEKASVVPKSPLKEKIDDLLGCLEPGMSQDDAFCFGALVQILPSIKSENDFQHFTTDLSR